MHTTHRFQVGAFACTLVLDGHFAYPHPGHTFLANLPEDEQAAAIHAIGLDHTTWHEYLSPYPSLVVDTGRHRVLIDTGAGSLGPLTGRLQPNLLAAGIDPVTIDTVILTHGHADHIGGNLTAAGTPAFPKARYVMGKDEWDFWTQSPDLSPLLFPDFIKQALIDVAAAQLPPIEPQLDLLDHEGEIVPGIMALAAPGHTPGHMALAIQSDGQELLHLVDTVLHPIQLSHPASISVADYDPAQTTATRRRLLDRAAAAGTLTMLFHFPFPSLGRIVEADQGWAWRGIEDSSQL
jgi:glyoxylase-like metal-dependent hydrolase (beta-lactamase superfamily II)